MSAGDNVAGVDPIGEFYVYGAQDGECVIQPVQDHSICKHLILFGFLFKFNIHKINNNNIINININNNDNDRNHKKIKVKDDKKLSTNKNFLELGSKHLENGKMNKN